MRGLSKEWLATGLRQFNNTFCKTLSCSKYVMSRRLCSTKPSILQSITKKVDPFGRLMIDLPYNVEIKPTDPHEYPDMDTLLVKLLHEGGNRENQTDLISVDVTSADCDKYFDIRATENKLKQEKISCLIEAPVSYDIEAKTTGQANVAIHDMISNVVNVQTEFGDIIASKLQGQEISLSSSEGGSIKLLKSIQGDIEVNTAKDGSVDAEKCLGRRLDVSTENGSVRIGSNYCENSTFTTFNGNLKLNNLHMDTTIDMNGNGSLDIPCLDGSLQANLHEVIAKIQIVRITGDCNIKSRGDVSLTIPEDCDANFILEAQKFDVDPIINGTFTEDGKKLIVENNGCEFHVETDKTIQVTRSNWLESLKLGSRSKQ